MSNFRKKSTRLLFLLSIPLYFIRLEDTLSAAEKFYVTINPVNQLGNQLFGVAAALAYAWDHDLIPVFPSLNELNANKSLNKNHLFFRLNFSNSPKTWTNTYEDLTWEYHPIPFYQDVILKGWFPSWKYFHHHREALLALLQPSDEVLNKLYTKYGHLFERSNTVGIHVRTYAKNHAAFPFVGLKYFQSAMEQFPADSIFVVISDRIKWCKVNFTRSFPNKKFVFIDRNNHIEDLFLFSKMKHNILSNSTYSFWGAYFNTNPNKIVCVPNRIVRSSHKQWPLADFFLPEWRIIDHDILSESYPEDMYWYDKETTSLDEKHQ